LIVDYLYPIYSSLAVMRTKSSKNSIIYRALGDLLKVQFYKYIRIFCF